MEQSFFTSTQRIRNMQFLSKKLCVEGITLADDGKLPEALKKFTKAIEADPRNHIAYYNRATIKIDLGDVEGARNDFYQFDRFRT